MEKIDQRAHDHRKCQTRQKILQLLAAGIANNLVFIIHRHCHPDDFGDQCAQRDADHTLQDENSVKQNSDGNDINDDLQL